MYAYLKRELCNSLLHTLAALITKSVWVGPVSQPASQQHLIAVLYVVWSVSLCVVDRQRTWPLLASESHVCYQIVQVKHKHTLVDNVNSQPHTLITRSSLLHRRSLQVYAGDWVFKRVADGWKKETARRGERAVNKSASGTRKLRNTHFVFKFNGFMNEWPAIHWQFDYGQRQRWMVVE